MVAQGWYTKSQIKGIADTKFGELPNATRIGIPNSYQYIPLAIMIHLAEKYGMQFNKLVIDGKGKKFNVPTDLQEVKKSMVNTALQGDGAHSKKILLSAEYVNKVRNQYLHRSTTDTIGKGGRYKDGKPFRKIIDG